MMLRRVLNYLGAWVSFTAVITLVSVAVIGVIAAAAALPTVMKPAVGVVFAAYELVRSVLPHTDEGWLCLIGGVVLLRFHWLLSEIERHLRELKISSR